MNIIQKNENILTENNINFKTNYIRAESWTKKILMVKDKKLVYRNMNSSYFKWGFLSMMSPKS